GREFLQPGLERPYLRGGRATTLARVGHRRERPRPPRSGLCGPLAHLCQDTDGRGDADGDERQAESHGRHYWASGSNPSRVQMSEGRIPTDVMMRVPSGCMANPDTRSV